MQTGFHSRCWVDREATKTRQGRKRRLYQARGFDYISSWGPHRRRHDRADAVLLPRRRRTARPILRHRADRTAPEIPPHTRPPCGHHVSLIRDRAENVNGDGHPPHGLLHVLSPNGFGELTAGDIAASSRVVEHRADGIVGAMFGVFG